MGLWWRDYLKRLAEVNQREFGGQPPACCGHKPVHEPADQRQGPNEDER
ncbi:MAG: LDCC motif putative metal-binding protein [bacterium]